MTEVAAVLVIAALLVHAALLGGPVARLLARVEWATRYPQVALRIWHACALGLLASLAGVLTLTAHDLWEHGMVWLFHADKPLIHAAYGGAWQVRGLADAALLALLSGAGGLLLLALRKSVRLNRERDRHRLTADAQGFRDPASDASLRVLAHEAPAAFCIPGPLGRSRIVVTTAARDLLSAAELDATLEHERAHLRLRHHRAILLADVVTAALGRMGLLRAYALQVRRLSEMAADDQAARKYGRRTVATALLEMCSAPGPGAGAPGLPAMTGPDLGERIRRLIATPRATAGPVAGVLACVVTAVVVTLPAVLAMAPAILLAGTAHLPGAG